MTEHQNQAANLPGAKGVAWVCFLFGTVVSVAFNVMDSFIPPVGAPAGWTPGLWVIVFAATWPLALIGSVELLARLGWSDTIFAKIVRYGVMSAVAVFAAVISYQHIREVLLSWRYNELSANVGPLVIDGLMILAGYAMVMGSKNGEAKPSPKTSTQAAPELPAKSEPGPALGDMLKPLPVQKPPVRNRTNGIKPAQARRSAGPSTQDIVSTLRKRGDVPTKRAIVAEFGVGSLKAQEARNLLKSDEKEEL
jgi:hypothetical protein